MLGMPGAPTRMNVVADAAVNSLLAQRIEQGIGRGNRYVHSPDFAPSPSHLTALWDQVSQLVVICLSRKTSVVSVSSSQFSAVV